MAATFTNDLVCACATREIMTSLENDIRRGYNSRRTVPYEKPIATSSVLLAYITILCICVNKTNIAIV